RRRCRPVALLTASECALRRHYARRVAAEWCRLRRPRRSAAAPNRAGTRCRQAKACRSRLLPPHLRSGTIFLPRDAPRVARCAPAAAAQARATRLSGAPRLPGRSTLGRTWTLHAAVLVPCGSYGLLARLRDIGCGAVA